MKAFFTAMIMILAASAAQAKVSASEFMANKDARYLTYVTIDGPTEMRSLLFCQEGLLRDVIRQHQAPYEHVGSAEFTYKDLFGMNLTLEVEADGKAQLVGYEWIWNKERTVGTSFAYGTVGNLDRLNELIVFGGAINQDGTLRTFPFPSADNPNYDVSMIINPRISCAKMAELYKRH